MSETRKIAAILVSDIVGFSRLAGTDEDRLLARLRALRSDLIDPIIAVHHGRVVKRTGDGALVEFHSVVDAVRCAIEVQNGMIERNAGLPPERRIEFRIGIHLGDVVEEADGDLMGDGVNIAARLEGVAQPGSICLSEDAYRQVSARLDMIVVDLGPTQLKNIDRPIRVYALQVGTPAQAKPAKAGKPPPKARASLALAALAVVGLVAVAAGVWRWRGEERPVLAQAAAVAVLPFDNLGGDEQASRLADGMTEDVITDLGRFREFLVIGRNSVMQYKGKPVDVRQVARDLNVNYVLTGSIQHHADRLRVTAQLIDAATGAEVWSQRWDRPSEDLFAVQAEVAGEVAQTLAGRHGVGMGPIKDRLFAEAKRRPLASLSAYQFYLLAREQNLLNTKQSNAKSWEYLEKALALDPNLSHAYALRAWLILRRDTPWEIKIKEFESDVRHALTLDPASPSGHAGLMNYFAMEGRWGEATVEIEAALRDNPTNTLLLNQAAFLMAYLGKPEEGVALADRNIRLDPQMPKLFYSNLSFPYYFARQFERAIVAGEQQPATGRSPFAGIILAASYAFLGRSDEANRVLADVKANNPEQVFEIWFNKGEVFVRAAEQELEREAFVKLGLRICATPEELKKYASPKRLPECVNK